MVTNTPGVLTNATAEIAFALLIILTRKIMEADRFTRAGRFSGWDPLLLLGDELKGKTLGIIGMGRIGQEMALKCRAFGMDIIYHNRKPVDQETENRLSASYASLDKLLQQSDAISIHTPLNDETYHLVNKQTFDQMHIVFLHGTTVASEILDNLAVQVVLVPVVAFPLDPLGVKHGN